MVHYARTTDKVTACGLAVENPGMRSCKHHTSNDPAEVECKRCWGTHALDGFQHYNFTAKPSR